MKRILFPTILILSIVLSACGAKQATEAPPTATVEKIITSTPDACSSAYLPGEVTKVNKLMREFDDYSSLASNTPQSQLLELIPPMQGILRDAEDLQVPACLTDLKRMQLIHMNMVIQTLMAFLNSADPELINAAVAKSREAHKNYDIEIARLLGVTLVVPTTQAPEATQSPGEGTTGFSLVNPGPTGLNLRSAPSLDAPEAGLLDIQVSTVALGRSADNLWIKVENPNQPGQTAWVFASLVQLSVPIDQLPITEE